MPQIAFSGTLTEGDFRAIQWLAVRRMWMLATAGFAVLFVMVLWQGGFKTWGSAVSWLPILAFLPLMLVVQRISIRRHWTKNKVLHLPVSGVAAEDGFQWNIQDLSSARFPWNLMLGYRETEALVLVYQGPNQVFYFPRRYFSSDDDWAAFRLLVVRKVRRK